MANSTLSILQDAKFDFVLDDKASTSEYFVLRTQYCNGDEVETFIRELERLTNSNFRVQVQRKDPTKIVFRKRWVCKYSSFKKKPCSKQNVGCKSFIDVMIKKITENTRKTDPFLRRKDPLPCVIKIDLNHIHSTECADAIRKLDVTPEIIREFEEYFKNGLAVCEARRLHESKLITNYNHAITYNSAYNPTEKQVYYLYDKWRKINYGSISDPFTKLKEKLSYYENEGSIVKFQEDNIWSILIITPVMQRIQQLVTSSEIIFLDSTSGCESTGSTVTVLIASTKAGGIPIAVILHPCQTEESYTNAFKLLKDTASSCFGGKKSPAIFMTDDSAAEKNALQTVWPDSRQLLCHFHVAQAEWRWLTSNMSDVCPGERQEVMKLFQAVMYATDKENLKKNYDEILKREKQNPKFVKRFLKFFDRGEEWLAFHRLNMLTRNHNTNNLCEAAIRVIKEIILSRTKAFNVVALVEFIIDVFDKYLVSRLIKKSRGEKTYDNLYSDLCSKMETVKVQDVTKLGENVYLVPSSTRLNIRYVVNTEIGYCTCLNGKTGAFCKHQWFIMNHFNVKLPNAPVLSAEERHSLVQMALGPQCELSQSFFGPFLPNGDDQRVRPENEHSAESYSADDFLHLNEKVPAIEENESSTTSFLNDNSNASEEEKEDFLKQIQRLMTFNIHKKTVLKLTKCMKSINTDGMLNEKLMRINAALSIKRRKINVQPTAINRRRKGMPKKRTPVPAGRPSKSNFNKKRKHSLKENIKKNLPNSKK